MANDKICEHVFVATPQKGEWMVEVRSTNNRGNPSDERVSTTVFACQGCGAQKEYPDVWERNYVAPKDAGKIISPPAKRAPDKKKTAKKKKVKSA